MRPAGLKAFTTASLVSRYGPSNNCIHAGTETNTCIVHCICIIDALHLHELPCAKLLDCFSCVRLQKKVRAAHELNGQTRTCLSLGEAALKGLTSSIVSRIAFGFPGKFMIKLLPLSPAVCRESTAVGTCLRIQWGQEPSCMLDKDPEPSS